MSYDIFDDITLDLKNRGISDRIIEKVKNSTPDFSKWPELDAIYKMHSMQLSTEGWRMAISNSIIPQIVTIETMNHADIPQLCDSETNEHYVFKTKDAECKIPKSDLNICALWKIKGKKREYIGSYSGERMFFDVLEAGGRHGIEMPIQFTSKAASMYALAPLLNGTTAQLWPSQSIYLSQSNEFEDDGYHALPYRNAISKYFNALCHSELLSSIGKPMKESIVVIEPKDLWKHAKLLGKPSPLDKAYAHIDSELIPALHELNPKYSAGWDGRKLYIVDTEAKLQCSYDDFERSWFNTKQINHEKNIVELSPVIERTPVLQM